MVEYYRCGTSSAARVDPPPSVTERRNEIAVAPAASKHSPSATSPA